jgi:glycosyltransferase involved in cell wall biosynthesis
MNQRPVFSVVIPTYNREDLILKTLNTVFAQTYPHYEILVVDNCSTDNTEQVLEPYISSRKIRFFKHDRNYERAKSRNTGMENATGDFVTFLDSDDLMYPNNLRDAADYVFSNSDIRFFHNLYELVDLEGNVLYRYRFPALDNPIRAIAEGNFLSCIGIFIHQDIYQRYRFDTTSLLTGSEDWEFWLRVIADYRLGRVEKINSGIVRHGGRTVNTINLEQLRERIDYIITKLSNDPHLCSVYKKHLKRLAANSCIYMATVANSAGQHGDALRLLREALTKDFIAAMSSINFIAALRAAILRVDKG